jgi:hypothetical protein
VGAQNGANDPEPDIDPGRTVPETVLTSGLAQSREGTGQAALLALAAIWLLRMGQPKGADGLSSMVDANDMRERGVPMTHTAQHLGRMHYWLSGSVRWQASRTVMLACKKAR